jgi:hypothetical protein
MVRVGGLLASAAAGACWLIALFLPWTADGTLSATSLLDAVELVRRGAVDAVVPTGAAVVLLVPALAGVVVIGVVGFAGRTATVVRVGALAIGLIGSIALVLRLSGTDPGGAGPGTWVALVGVLFAAQALGFAIYAMGAGQSSSA